MSLILPFRDRQEAGEMLAQSLMAEVQAFIGQTGSSSVDSTELTCGSMADWAIVYALPRGGLPVAEPIARQLGCPLDILVAKKITYPESPEFAVGAVTASGQILWLSRDRLKAVSYLNDRDLESQHVALNQAQDKALAQFSEIHQACPWITNYATAPLFLRGKIAILVDDGIATGMTMAVAAQALKQQQPIQVWCCAPVGPVGLEDSLQDCCDRLIVLEKPDPFMSVSRFYRKFPQVSMEEVIACLHRNHTLLTDCSDGAVLTKTAEQC